MIIFHTGLFLSLQDFKCKHDILFNYIKRLSAVNTQDMLLQHNFQLPVRRFSHLPISVIQGYHKTVIIIIIMSRDIKMVFGIEKCRTLCIAKGKLEMRNFTTEDDDTMEAMNEDDMYRYLGHMQAKQINHVRMKQKLGEE